MKLKRIISGFSAVVMLLSALSFSAFSTVSAEPANNVFDDLNQKQITEEMGPGWNLGNQLEASSNGVPSETAWDNPVITQETFKMVKEAGFKNVRIPVSYLSKIGPAPDYTIETAWLNRIQEVVDMALAEGLYVIINMHGDGYNSVQGAWLLCNAPDDEQPAIKAKYAACWEQIATLFKDYDEHLIFESMNEEFDGLYAYENGEEYPNRAYYANINAYNQIFVDTVRKTGANNAKRWLLIPGWNTDINYTTGDYGFELPTDTNRDASIPDDEQRIMVSVHYYNPYDFCGDEKSSKTQWGTDTEIKSMQDLLSRCYTTFVMKGYPVVIGEYGAINKFNEGDRVKYYGQLCKNARSRGMIPVAWDNNGHGVGADKFGLFDRETFEIIQKKIIDAIMDAYKGEAEPAPEIIDPITKSQALAVINSNKDITIVNGVADAAMNGAAQVRYVFDCASDVSFNKYTSIQFSSTVAGTNSSITIKGDSDLTGTTENKAVLKLVRTIKTGNIYSISAYTGSWMNAKDYVFLIKRLEFLDSSGKIIKTIDKSNKPIPPASTAPTTGKDDSAITAMKKAKISKLTVKSKARRKITVSWRKVKNAKGYQVQIAKKKSFKGKQIIFKKLTSKIKLKVKSPKIKSKKTYFVRVRAYATYKNSKGKTKKVYSKFSKKVKVKVK